MLVKFKLMCFVSVAALLTIGDSTTAGERTSDAAAESVPPGNSLGREYVPPDAVFMSVVFPRRTLSRPELAGAPIEQVLRKFGHLERPLEMPVPTRFLADLGIRLENVEQAICVVTGFRTAGDANSAELQREEEFPRAERAEEQTDPDSEQDSWLYGPLMEAYVVRLTVAVPREGAVGLLFRPQEIALGGKTYFGQGRDTGAVAVHFPDERTMVVGEERVVRKILAHGDRPSALAAALDQTEREADIWGAIDVAAVRDQLKRQTGTGPQSKDAADDAMVATFFVRLDPRPFVKVVVRAKTAEAGDKIVEWLRTGLTEAREQLAAMSAHPAEADVRELRALAGDVFTRGLNALQVERAQNRVEIALTDFAPLTDLTALLKRFNAAALQHVVVPLPAIPLFDEDGTATAIRRLIPAAAGCRAEILAAIARSEVPTTPQDLMKKDLGLSMIVLIYRIPPPGMYESHAEEFRFDAGLLDPSELARELLRNRYLGYYSMIQPDRITDFTCDVEGQTAKGSVSFKVPRLYEGKVQYLAERVEGRWRIKEFHLPIHRWRFARTEDGQWNWFNFFGDVGDVLRRAGPVSPPWPGQQSVSGKITLDGKPLTEATIEFFHNVDVLFQGSAFAQDGSYRTKLPTGSYHVVILNSRSEAPKKYRTPDRSELMIEVQEGENTINFDLATE